MSNADNIKRELSIWRERVARKNELANNAQQRVKSRQDALEAIKRDSAMAIQHATNALALEIANADHVLADIKYAPQRVAELEQQLEAMKSTSDKEALAAKVENMAIELARLQRKLGAM